MDNNKWMTSATTTENNNNYFIHTDESYKLFLDAIVSDSSKVVFVNGLKYFKEFVGVPEYYRLLDNRNQPRLLEADIKRYVDNLRNARKVAPATVGIYVGAIMVFLDANDVEGIRWDKINKAKGGYYSVVEDRPYKRDEINRLVEGKTDQRNKGIILLLASSGIRVGAVPELKRGHLKEINNTKYGD